MTASKSNEERIAQVEEIFVAVFPAKLNDHQSIEVILAGYERDPDHPDMLLIRATVETYVEALPELVALCDKIVEDQEEIETYRLLKFDRNGIHELHQEDYREPEYQHSTRQWWYA